MKLLGMGGAYVPKEVGDWCQREKAAGRSYSALSAMGKPGTAPSQTGSTQGGILWDGNVKMARHPSLPPRGGGSGTSAVLMDLKPSKRWKHVGPKGLGIL